MGKHHKKRSPAFAPTVLTGTLAFVVVAGLVGQADTVEVDGAPSRTPEVRSTRPSSHVAPGASGGRTETDVPSRTTPRPARSAGSVPQRSRAVESSPSAPARDRSTSPTPQVPAATASESHPAPAPKPTCRRQR